MNLIKNFFHAFGDIIFGLVVVGIAVFLIGTQINNDFDMFELGNKAYNTIITKINGSEPSDEPAEILADPSNSDSEVSPSSVNLESEDANTKATAVDTQNSEEDDVIPEDVPAIRNIEISAGSTADQVASGLFANGIIGSKEEFLAEYARLPVGRNIVGGKFQIPSGSTSSEILAIIAPE